MKFAQPELESQLSASHPGLREVLENFEELSEKENLPTPTITEVWRTPAQQEEIYFGIWSKLMARLKTGEQLTPNEAVKAAALVGLSDEQIRLQARGKFSWHLCRTAVDIRTREYSKPQLARVVEWFHSRCPSPVWEVISEPHGTAPHLHIAARSWPYRRKFTNPAVS